VSAAPSYVHGASSVALLGETIGDNLRDRVVALGVLGDRVTSVMRPVAARFTPGNQGQARHRCGLAIDRTVLLWVGRLVPVKGVETLLRAVELLRSRHPALTLCIAGDGPDSAKLTALAERLAAPLLATLPFVAAPDFRQVAAQLDLTGLS